MDVVVKEMNYIKPSEKDVRRHYEEIHNSKYDCLSKSELERVLVALGDQLKKGWPQYKEDGYHALLLLVQRLKSIVENRDSNEAEKLRLSLFPTYLNTCEACIRGGFSAAHVDVMKDLIGIVPWEEDQSTMTAEHFRNFMNLLKLSDFQPPKEDKNAKYVHEYGAYFFRFFLERVSEEFMRSHVSLVTEYAHVATLRMWHPTTETVAFFSEVLRYLRYSLDAGELTEELMESDPGLLLRQWNELLVRLKNETIPTKDGQTVVTEEVARIPSHFSGHPKFACDALPVMVGAWADLVPLSRERPYLMAIMQWFGWSIPAQPDENKATLYKGAQALLPKVRSIADQCLVTPVPTDETELDGFHRYLQAVIMLLTDISQSKEIFKTWCPLICGMIRSAEIVHLEEAQRVLVDPKVPVLALCKSEPGILCNFLDAILETSLKFGKLVRENDENESYEAIAVDSRRNAVQSCADTLLTVIHYIDPTVFETPAVQKTLLTCCQQTMKHTYPLSLCVFRDLMALINWKKCSQQEIKATLEAFKIVVAHGSEYSAAPPWCFLGNAVFAELTTALESDMSRLKENLPLLTDIISVCADRDQEGDACGYQSITMEGSILQNVFYKLMFNSKDITVYTPLYPLLIRTCQHTESTCPFHSMWFMVLGNLPMHKEFAVMAMKYLPEIIALFNGLMENGTANDMNAALSLTCLFRLLSEHAVETMAQNFDHILSAMEAYSDSHSAGLYVSLVALVRPVGMAHPEIITPRLVACIQKFLELQDECFTSLCVVTCFEISRKRKASLLIPMESTLMGCCRKCLDYCPQMALILQQMILEDPSRGEHIFMQLDQLLQLCEAKMPFYLSSILHAILTSAPVRPDLVAARKARFEALSKLSECRQVCQDLLDMIANRSLVGVDTKVGQQQTEISDMKTKMEDLGRRMNELEKKVEAQSTASMENSSQNQNPQPQSRTTPPAAGKSRAPITSTAQVKRK